MKPSWKKHWVQPNTKPQSYSIAPTTWEYPEQKTFSEHCCNIATLQQCYYNILPTLWECFMLAGLLLLQKKPSGWQDLQKCLTVSLLSIFTVHFRKTSTSSKLVHSPQLESSSCRRCDRGTSKSTSLAVLWKHQTNFLPAIPQQRVHLSPIAPLYRDKCPRFPYSCTEVSHCLATTCLPKSYGMCSAIQHGECCSVWLVPALC